MTALAAQRTCKPHNNSARCPRGPPPIQQARWPTPGPKSMEDRSFTAFLQVSLARPCTIFNGGDPTGRLTDITWSSWGTPEAVGVGTAFTMGDAQSVAGGHRQYGGRVVAFDLGPCGPAGLSKDRVVSAWLRRLFDPANARNICTWQYGPWQPEFGRPLDAVPRGLWAGPSKRDL